MTDQRPFVDFHFCNSLQEKLGFGVVQITTKQRFDDIAVLVQWIPGDTDSDGRQAVVCTLLSQETQEDALALDAMLDILPQMFQDAREEMIQ